MKKNLAIIGSGNIAPFHIEAAIRAGFSISAIASSHKSKSAKLLSQKYEIPKCFPDVDDLLEENSFDCLSIMIPPATLEKLLLRILPIKKPILIEKPLALTSNSLDNFTGEKNIFVAYNRRFYKTIGELKSESVKSKGIYSFEAVESLEENCDTFESIKFKLVNNTVHVFDLIKYLIGDYKMKEFVFSKVNYTLKARLYVKSKYSGDFRVSFGSKRNSNIEFENQNLNITLKPLEYLQKFSQLEVTQPTDNCPLRIYTPVWNNTASSGTVNDSDRYKPGFVEQYRELMTVNEVERKSFRLATVQDAQDALKKCEDVLAEYRSNWN